LWHAKLLQLLFQPRSFTERLYALERLRLTREPKSWSRLTRRLWRPAPVFRSIPSSRLTVPDA